jgi:HK97 family phage major capsid protein
MITIVDHVRSSRDTARAEAEAMLTRAETEGRDLTAAEASEYSVRVANLAELDNRVRELETNDRRGPSDVPHVPQVRVGHEPGIYRPDSTHSYFQDILRRQLHGDGGAADRLARHRVEVETRDIARVDGAGGEFVPPIWLVDQYAEFARATRVTTSLFSQFPLPGGTDSINIPKITTGPQAAAQTADNAAVQNTDAVTATVTAPVRTIAGQQNVAIQLLDQSPIAFDQVIFRELIADYNRVLEAQVLTGTGASGQLQGIIGLSGTSAITYTDASPTVPELYAPLTQGVAAVMANRLLPPEAIVINGRRWAWIAGALDSNNRPFLVPDDNDGQNTLGKIGGYSTGGPVGQIAAMPVYASMAMPVNLGAGTNEDRVIVGRYSDSYFYESTMRTRVLPDILSSNLTVRLQVYNYVALAHRFPASYAIVSGTGLAFPAGY